MQDEPQKLARDGYHLYLNRSRKAQQEFAYRRHSISSRDKVTNDMCETKREEKEDNHAWDVKSNQQDRGIGMNTHRCADYHCCPVVDLEDKMHRDRNHHRRLLFPQRLRGSVHSIEEEEKHEQKIEFSITERTFIGWINRSSQRINILQNTQPSRKLNLLRHLIWIRYYSACVIMVTRNKSLFFFPSFIDSISFSLTRKSEYTSFSG